MIKFGVSDSIIVPVLLPGAVLCISSLSLIFLVFHADILTFEAFQNHSISHSLNMPYGTLLAVLLGVSILLAYVVSVLLGVFLSILGGYIEYYVLDKLSAKRFGLSHEEYWKLWHRYLDHLEKEGGKNSYMSGFVDLFLFQLRLSIALLVLALVAIFCGIIVGWDQILGWAVLVPLLFAGILFRSSYCYHFELADFRRLRFSEKPRKVSDIVQTLLSMWCQREAFGPLRTVLPFWPVQSDRQSLDKLKTALSTAMASNAEEVFGSERKLLQLAMTELDSANTTV